MSEQEKSPLTQLLPKKPEEKKVSAKTFWMQNQGRDKGLVISLAETLQL